MAAVITLSVTGLILRGSANSNTARYIDGLTEYRLAEFLAHNTFENITRVSYTRDKGIRGLQVRLPECNGNLQIVVMPEGDEFSSLWELRAQQANYRTAYLFRQKLYPTYPAFSFWLKTMFFALAQRLQISIIHNPGPVIAVAYPLNCKQANQVPWQHFKPV